MPALKPLEHVPTVMVEATVASDPPIAHDPVRLTALMFDPPTPALKPIGVASSVRFGPLSSRNDGAAARQARSKESLPVALRAWWTKVKLLLASTQASRVRPANSSGAGQAGFQDSFGARVASADTGGEGANGGGGGNTSDGSGSAGGNPSGGDAGTSGDGSNASGGGSTGGGGGPGGGGDGGGGASGGGASGGGASGGGASGGGNGGGKGGDGGGKGGDGGGKGGGGGKGHD
jgi:hypothetical protein